MKLAVPFIQLPLLFDAAALADEINVLDAGLWQPHPTGFPGNTALPLVAAEGDSARGDALFGRMRPTPALARCAYLRQVLASLGAVIGRVRLMRLAPGAEVAAHVDTNHYWKERVRVHVPVLTDPSVQFVCGDAAVHMGAGECWIFDTWKLHRVINGPQQPRVHLVIDTVGSAAFAKLVNAGRGLVGPEGGWAPSVVSPDAKADAEVMFESMNLMAPMSYWELRENVDFLLDECAEHPLLPVVRYYANEFVIGWRTLWFRYGMDAEGLPAFRELLADFLDRMRQVAADLTLRNDARLVAAFNGMLGQAARTEGQGPAGEEATRAPVFHASAVSAPAKYEFERPVFIVSPPRSGSSLLFETLAQSPDAYTIGGESHGIIEGNTAFGVLGAAARGYDSNRLDAAAATPEIVVALRERFHRRAFNRNHEKGEGRIRLLEKTPKNALRVPFLTQVFPDALFVYLYRDPREVLASMMEAWQSGGFRSYPQLPGWTGLPWSMVLTPGWRDLIGKELPDIVCAQWQAVTEVLLDDLEALPAERWVATRYDRFVADPEQEVERICAGVGLRWDRQLERQLPLAGHTVSAPHADKWRRHEREILARMPQIASTVARAERYSLKDLPAPARG